MTWEQKLSALGSLAGSNIALHMRAPGDWYTLSGGVEIGDGRMLSSCGGNGTTPEAAVCDHWERVTNLKPDEFLVVDAMPTSRRHVRWNGYMWDVLPSTA